jgi:predicted dehydrogenase
MTARIAVVGASGWAGSRHVAAFAEAGARVAALVDPSPRTAELAAVHDARPLTDVAELTPDEVDLVVVALPSSLQPAVCRELLGAGHRVLVEKPLAPGLADTVALADVPGIDERLMVGFTLRGHPAVAALRDWVAAERPVAMTVRSVARKRAVDSWRANPAEGGVLVVNGVHALDLALHLLGTRATVRSVDTGSRLYAAGVADHVATSVDLGGTLLRLETYWSPWELEEGLNAGDWDLTVDLVAPHGRRLWRNAALSAWERDSAARVTPLGEHDLFRVQADAALAFAGGAPAPAGFRDALAVARLVDAITAAERTTSEGDAA